MFRNAKITINSHLVPIYGLLEIVLINLRYKKKRLVVLHWNSPAVKKKKGLES